MNEVKCPRCGGEVKVIPAGTSKKTGKPYAAFYSCKTWECGGTAKMTDEAPANPHTSNSASTGRPTYDSFPKKEVKTVMDYKQRQIGESQSNKNEGIRLSGSCRDATMIVTTFYKDCTFSDEQIKEKILFWRSWFYKDVYNMTDDEYKLLNVPF
jgi:hypothetical protein